MKIVNFSINPILAKRINQTMKVKGFSSKAEFFRTAAIYFIDVIDKPSLRNEDERFDMLTAKLDQLLSHKIKGKKFLSLKEQLKDI